SRASCASARRSTSPPPTGKSTASMVTGSVSSATGGRSHRRFWSVVALAAIGCGGSSGTKASMYIDGFNPPPPNANETAVVSPVFPQIAPGTDEKLCSYLDTTFTDATDIVNFRAFQSLPGHHVMLTAVRRSQDPNTHP